MMKNEPTCVIIIRKDEAIASTSNALVLKKMIKKTIRMFYLHPEILIYSNTFRGSYK